MKRTISTILIFCAGVMSLASCGKWSTPGNVNSSAIKLTVSGVQTKARVITDKGKHSETIYDYIEDAGFNISAYVTEIWRRDVIGNSPDISAGIFVDPGPYQGPYDESTYPNNNYKLQNVHVSYDSNRDREPWRIEGNEDYANPKFSWVNGVPMNFFAYAPVPYNTVGGVDYSIKGTLTITKENDSVDANYPFEYSAKSVSGEVTSANCDDLLFAFTQNTATYESDHTSANYGKLVDGSDKINILFHHALAQIRFCVDPADFPDTKLVSVKLKGPENSTVPSTFDGIFSSGSCVFSGTSATKFTWTGLEDGCIYSQEFNGTSGVSFAGGVPTGWKESTYDTDKTLYTCVGDVFFVIPQSLGECAVEIKIQEGSNPEQILKGHLPATTSGSTDVSWESGKYYTYKLNRGSIDLLLTGGLGPYLTDWWD